MGWSVTLWTVDPRSNRGGGTPEASVAYGPRYGWLGTLLDKHLEMAAFGSPFRGRLSVASPSVKVSAEVPTAPSGPPLEDARTSILFSYYDERGNLLYATRRYPGTAGGAHQC